MKRERDGLRYFVDVLPHGRGQMMADLIDKGRVVLTWTVGSPAPMKTVERAAAEWNR